MRSGLQAMLLVGAFAFVPAVQAVAQTQPQSPPAARQPPPGPGTGMGMGKGMGPGMGMGPGHCMGMSDVQLETLKRQLGVTSAQLPHWNAFAEAVRSNMRSMAQAMGHADPARTGQGQARSMPPAALPERIEWHERMMTGRLEALRSVKAPLLRLYGSFTPEQKAKADALMCAPHGMGAAPG